MDQIAKGEKIAIDPNGEPPTIQITIGSSVIGFYTAFLWRGTSHPSTICKGRSSDKPPKVCPIATDPSTLPGTKVSWQVGTAAENDSFPIVVTLSQGGTTLKTYTYNAQGDVLLVDSVRLVAA
jgi:hypothetical protein